MAKRNAVLNIIFGADTKELDKALQGVAKRLRSTADDLNGLGQSLSLGLTAPIVAFGALATKNAVDSAKAIAQVEAAVESTGMAAGRSVAQLEELAGGLQRISLYDDDQILKEVTANLLTFTKVTGTNFDKAQVAILNLSTRLGTDLTSASVQVGKALNDPIKGVTALGRAGVQFTAQQKELITTLTESGDVAGAQSIILAELETQFGGAAEAAANVDPYTQLANEIGNLSEDFGAIINDAIKPLVRFVREAVDAIKSWSDETKATVLVVGGLLAVLGPTLIAVAGLINAYTTIKGALLTAKTAQLGFNLSILANPYVAAAAAVGVLVAAMVLYKTETDNARKAKQDFDNVVAGKSGRSVMDEAAKELSRLNGELQNARTKYDNLKRAAESQGANVTERTARQIVETSKLVTELERQQLAAQKVYQTASKQEQQRIQDTKTLQSNTEAQDENTVAVTNNVTARDTAYETFRRNTAAYMAEQQALEDLNAEMNNTALTLADLGEGPSVSEAILGKSATPEAPMNLMEFDQPDEVISEDAIEGVNAFGAALRRARVNEAQPLAVQMEAIDDIVNTLGQNMQSVGAQFGEALGGIITGAEGARDAMRGVAMAAIDAAFNAATALAVQAAGQTAVGTGPGAAIVLPALITAGMALIKSVFTNLMMPAFAQGGLVTGPMLAMVGDNQSGKEAIIPFERMGEFLQMAGAGQSQNVVVTGRISGNDILLTNDRASRDRSRIRGF
jgi:hypothetical protein